MDLPVIPLKQRHGDSLTLTSLQENIIESTKDLGRFASIGRVAEVKLGNFSSVNATGVFDSEGDSGGSSGETGVGEVGVGETVTKFEVRDDLVGIHVAVVDEELLSVVDLEKGLVFTKGRRVAIFTSGNPRLL